MDERKPEEERDGQAAAAQLLAVVTNLLGIVRRRWFIVAAFVLVSVGTAAFTLTRMTPYYRAKTTIVVHATQGQVLDSVRGVNDEELWSPTAYAEYTGTQKEIIKSRKVAAEALKQLGLADDPVFLGISGLEGSEREAAREAIDPVARLQSMISVGTVPESRVVWIAVEYPDPKLAQEMVDEVRDAYLSTVTRNRQGTGDDAKDKLGKERETARQELLDAEKTLDEFKDENNITSISLADRQNLITQNVSILSAKAKEAETVRIEADSTYQEAKKLHDKGSAAAASLVPKEERITFDEMIKDRVQAESEFEDAKVRYLPKMPEYQRAKKRVELLDRKIATARDDMVASLAARRRAAKTTENRLKASLATENDKALDFGRLEPKYRELERDVATAEETYQSVTRRDIEIGLTNRVEARHPVEMLDAATVPGAPVRPRRVIVLGLGLLAGLAIGIGAALVVDLRDQRIRSAADLSRAVGAFGVPILGQLPFLPMDPTLGASNIRAQRRRRDLHTFNHPRSRMAERARGIRTALKFNLPSESPVLLVTSPSSGDGKSSTAINLALSFCQGGQRVVLVDADLRRPRLNQLFPADVNKPLEGIDAVLTQDVQVSDAVRTGLEGAPQNLSVLTCNSIPDSPAELLDSGTFKKTLSELRRQFDLVLIDSPPVLRVTDPMILAPQVDGVIIVARCGSTMRNELRQTIDVLQQGNTNLVGIVLNHADSRAEKASYGYGYGYGGGYGPAYAPDTYQAEPS